MTTTHSPGGETANDVLDSSGARSGRGGRRGGRCPASRARQSATAGDGRRGGVHAVRVPVEGQPESHQLVRSEEHTSELQSRLQLVCRLLLEKKKIEVKADENTSNHNTKLITESIGILIKNI